MGEGQDGLVVAWIGPHQLPRGQRDDRVELCRIRSREGKRRVKKSWFVWMVISLLATGWMNTSQQYGRLRAKWDDTYANQAIVYSNELYNAAISLGYYAGVADVKHRSTYMGNVLQRLERIGRDGVVLDRMTRNGGVLSAVAWELQRFALGIWDENLPTANLFDNENGASLPDAEMAKLKEIYEVYVRHFTDQVIFSQDPKRHQTALVNAHNELRQKGYDKLLRSPDELQRAE